MNLGSQTQLAKLLAKENIDVHHGSYKTAFFDVEKRVLGLPIWKDRGKDVYDLLVGHEVGHALYTPADGWHGASTDIGINRSLVNIVEDIRIERKVQSNYPGLVSSFKRGYKVLFAENFFGTQDRPIESYGLPDRINIKAKLRDLVDVPFTSEEQPIVDMAMSVETWDDVLKACKAIQDFLNEEKEDTPIEPQGEVGMDNMENEYEDTQTDGSGFTQDVDQDNSEDNSDRSSSQISQDTQENRGSGEDEKQPIMSHKKEISQEDNIEVETDQAFREASDNLLETDNYGTIAQVANKPSQQEIDYVVRQYEDVKAARIEADTQKSEQQMLNESSMEVSFQDAYRDFIAETKKVTNVMAKEFEAKKAAYQYSRSQTSRSGSIDTTKLHNYKFSDDIFNRVTQLADAKSHGMVMFIDYSGSMSANIFSVAKQTLNLAMFCKKVNIPFEVYYFTTGSRRKDTEAPDPTPNSIALGRTLIWKALSSDMKKAVYEEASFELFKRAMSYETWSYVMYETPIESMGGTPLNETIIIADSILDKFKRRTGVQKTHAIFLTDGDGQNVRVNDSQYEEFTQYNFNPKKIIINMGGKAITITRKNDLTPSLYNYLRSKGTMVHGFFIGNSNREFNRVIARSHEGFCPSDKFNQLRSDLRKNKFALMKDVYGHDSLFLLKEGNNLNTDNDEFEVDEDASKGKIATAFKKYTKSKKGNRVLAAQFAAMVA